jgi:hypothetical protein
MYHTKRKFLACKIVSKGYFNQINSIQITNNMLIKYVIKYRMPSFLKKNISKNWCANETDNAIHSLVNMRLAMVRFTCKKLGNGIEPIHYKMVRPLIPETMLTFTTNFSFPSDTHMHSSQSAEEKVNL